MEATLRSEPPCPPERRKPVPPPGRDVSSGAVGVLLERARRIPKAAALPVRLEVADVGRVIEHLLPPRRGASGLSAVFQKRDRSDEEEGGEGGDQQDAVQGAHNGVVGACAALPDEEEDEGGDRDREDGEATYHW